MTIPLFQRCHQDARDHITPPSLQEQAKVPLTTMIWKRGSIESDYFGSDAIIPNRIQNASKLKSCTFPSRGDP